MHVQGNAKEATEEAATGEMFPSVSARRCRRWSLWLTQAKSWILVIILNRLSLKEQFSFLSAITSEIVTCSVSKFIARPPVPHLHPLPDMGNCQLPTPTPILLSHVELIGVWHERKTDKVPRYSRRLHVFTCIQIVLWSISNEGKFIDAVVLGFRVACSAHSARRNW